MLHGKQKGRKEGRRGEAGEEEQLQGPTPGTNTFVGALGYRKQTCKTTDALASLVSSSGSCKIFVSPSQSGFRASPCSGTCLS